VRKNIYNTPINGKSNRSRGYSSASAMAAKILIILFLSATILFCSNQNNNSSKISEQAGTEVSTMTNDKGMTLQTRFGMPAGFFRSRLDSNSFGFYLRNLPLKRAGSKVKYFNGDEKDDHVYIAVVNQDIGKKDLQQCADAVMRLRGEYFYSIKKYDKISFVITNGMKVDYSDWMKGNRVMVNGNKTSWKKTTSPSNTYENFRDYMDFIFTYAGTLSLSKNLIHKPIDRIEPGDVFIVGGSPGHAVIVVDVAQNRTGEKIFMLAQSYMPAQETQILKNLENSQLSPWYEITGMSNVLTPQWTFKTDQLMTWQE
jgi:hypothetical protein